MRVLTSKRDTKTGIHYHYCPITECYPDERITEQTCTMCLFLDCVEQKPQSYVIHCEAPAEGIQLYEFEPAKAYDEYRGLKELDILQAVSTHSWVEPKLDGARALVHLTPQGVFITSRRRNKDGHYNQFQDNVPHLRDHPGLQTLGKQKYAILDGEILMPGDRDTLARTMGIVGSKPDRAIALQTLTGIWIELHLFDLVYLENSDMTTTSLSDRHQILKEFMTRANNDAQATGWNYASSIQIVEHHKVDNKVQAYDLYTSYLDQGLEGCILKNPQSGYFDSHAWLKVKQRVTIDAIVTGWESGAKGGKYENSLGALKVSILTNDKLQEIARVIPGDDSKRTELLTLFNGKTDEQIKMLGMIVEMEAQGWTKDYRLRHPRILRYRADRSSPNIVDFSQVLTL